MMPVADRLDCLVVGAGPAGLTAALYLARFRRRLLIVDAGEPRAAWIPESHNIPFFAEGIAGVEILQRQRDSLLPYGVAPLAATVTELRQVEDGFEAHLVLRHGGTQMVVARRVLLATGAADIEPDLPDLQGAVAGGLVRYCPVCDGYEVKGYRIAVIGHGDRAVGEAAFIARTYGSDVTVLTLGRPLDLSKAQQGVADRHGLRIVHDPVESLKVGRGSSVTVGTGTGPALDFDVLYSALGVRYRSDLAARMGALRDEAGALEVDQHCQTTVAGLYAAGDVVRGLDQVVVGMGHAAIAAAHIHNRCELPVDGDTS